MDNVIDETTDTNSGSVSIRASVFLKWTKKLIEFETIIPIPGNNDDDDGSFTKFTGRSFKDIVYSLTKVPVDRQKVVVAKSKTSKIKWWKGILKNDFDFSSTLAAREDVNALVGETTTIELRATLMGTAEVLASKEEHTKTIFLEDMTPSEKKAEELREMMESMDKVAAMIPALQIPPPHRQPPSSDCNEGDENKESVDDAMPIVSEFEETRSYDRLVHGFSQLRIDALLCRQQKKPRNNQPPSRPKVLGRAVMTMGLELQRAYVNDLTVLNEDGTLVSGMDDGHVQMWKHCQRIRDLVHQPVNNAFPGVDSVLALDNNDESSFVSFATAGRGCIRFWNSALDGAFASSLWEPHGVGQDAHES